MNWILVAMGGGIGACLRYGAGLWLFKPNMSFPWPTWWINIIGCFAAGEAKFSDVLAFIEAAYTHTPTAFKNGLQHNAATENQGSAKVFSFAQLQGLNQAQTLSLFAEHYASVLATPDATDHQNIRQFMLNGWDGIEFDGTALTAK